MECKLGEVEYILGGLTFRTSQNTIVTGENNPKTGNTRNVCTADEVETVKTLPQSDRYATV